MELDSIARTVTSVVAEVAELSDEELWTKRDADLFEDLGLDSLLALEIVAALERKYRIEVPEERIVEVRTLTEAINLVKETLGHEGGRDAEAVSQ
jgi:acyl carrier protein